MTDFDQIPDPASCGLSGTSRLFLRPAETADAAGIARVHVQSWREQYQDIVPEAVLTGLDAAEREQRWRKSIETEKAPWGAFVGLSDQLRYAADTVVDTAVTGSTAGSTNPATGAAQATVEGFISFGAAREDFAGYAGEIYALYLLRAWQGTGAGRGLFDAARQSLRACGINTLYLWVLADNPSAGFYRHLGGREIGRKMIDIGGKQLEEIAYGWKEDCE